MLPLKRILCPVDFSEPSYRALKVAEKVVRLAPCPVLSVRAPREEEGE